MAKPYDAPWRYDKNCGMIFANNDQSHIADVEEPIVVIRGTGELGESDEAIAIQDARGRLIAAAPTLLEALKTYVKLAGPAAVTPGAVACNAAAVAAIEAAEGGEG